MILRPYQEKMVADIRQHWMAGTHRVLVTAPTGAGKTHIIAHATKEVLARGRKVGIVVHRRELLRQAVQAVTNYGVSPTAPGLFIGTIQGLRRRPIEPLDMLVVDEAHLALARTWTEFVAAQGGAYVIGLTATPYRLDGRGLDELFGALVVGPSVRDLVAQGQLVPARTFAPDVPDMSGVQTTAGDWDRDGVAQQMMRPQIVGSIVEHYRRLAAGRQTLCFGTTIEHSKMLCESFRAAGVLAEHIDGTMPTKKRDEIVSAFRAGIGEILTSCNVLSEGLDVPQIGCIILARPTQSEVIYRQQIGRGSRACEGKDDLIILDHAGNALRHGLYADEKHFTLEGTRNSAKQRQAPTDSVRQCLSCYGVYESSEPRCPYCGIAPPVKQRRTREIAGQLVELTESGKLEAGWYKSVMRPIWRSPRDEWRGLLMTLAVEMQYKQGWVDRQIAMHVQRP